MPQLTLSIETMSEEVSPDALVLQRVEGVEAISELYRYELTFAVGDDNGLSPEAQDDLLRKPCRIRFGIEGEEHEVHGMISRLRMHSVDEKGGVRFTATLVPRVWTATQVVRSRVFQDLDPPSLVAAVLAEHGLKPGAGLEMRVDGSYSPSEYTVQYQESDYDFINRVMEHHGIFWLLRQDPDGETLVVGDSNRAFDRLGDAPVTYEPRQDDQWWDRPAVIHALERTLTPRPTTVVLRDYNWRTPDVPLHVEAAADTTTGIGLYNRYGDHFKTPEEGQRLARVRAEQLLVDRERYHMRGRIVGLGCGHRIEITGHPYGEMDIEYVVTRIRHRAGDLAAGEHMQEIEAIPYSVPFRPALRTPKPRILGLMHGFVDGAVPGTAAPIDRYGRYKVLLPFDLAGRPGGKASRWIRLAQPASGPGYGIHFPLHIGAEVAISHVDGDPDRPVIVASPPNAKTLTPVTDANATQSKIRTQTGIRITFDDDVA